MTPQFKIQSVEAQSVQSATNVEEYASWIREASSSNQILADYGTHCSFGNPPKSEFVHISPPSGITDHWVPDMTVRALPATRFVDLQHELASKNQYLPLDAAADQTVADIIAHNTFGPLRTSHGSVKDLLLGLGYVSSAGELITVGGRTVKNVAGYDVSRCMVGNGNILGLISHAILRTYPIPECVQEVAISNADLGTLEQAMTDLLLGDAVPYYVDVIIHTTGNNVVPTALIGYAGTEIACRVGCDALKRWISKYSVASLDTSIDAGEIHSYAQNERLRMDRHAWRETVTGLVKIVVPPANTGQIVSEISHSISNFYAIDAVPTHGQIHVGGDWSIEDATSFNSFLKNRIRDSGFLLWIRRPNNAPEIQVCWPDSPDLDLQKRLKAAMDPANILNPGRFY